MITVLAQSIIHVQTEIFCELPMNSMMLRLAAFSFLG